MWELSMMNNGCRWIDGRPIIALDSLGRNEHITEWLALGPYRFQWPGRFTRDVNIGAADIVEDDPIGVERTVRPVLGMRHGNLDVPNGHSEWIQLSGATYYDLKTRYPEQDTALAWAVTYLSATKPTDIVVQTREWIDRRRCLVETMLDGVTVNVGDAPFLLRVDPGEHVLMVKIAGGASGNVAWHVDAVIGRPIEVADEIGIALVRSSGYWRGNEQAPRLEIDLALVNHGDAEITLKSVFAVGSNGERGPQLANVTVEPRTIAPARLSAPLGDAKPASRCTFHIHVDDASVPVDIDVPPLPDPGIIHVVEGFHCDPVWVSDQHHYNLVSLENVRQLLDGCLANPAYRCFLHEIDYLKPFVDEYPDYRAILFGLIQRGQVGLGSSYNQPNENNCSGEGIIRNLLYGDGFHRRFLGGDPLVYHAWDVFGHIPQLSQILAKAGCIGVIWSKHIWGFPPIFNHISPDGTALPHIRTPYGWGTHGIDRLRESVQPLVSEKHTYGLRRHLVMDSSDFHSPSSWMIGRTEEMADSFPTIVMSTPEAYLQGHIDDGAAFPITSRNPCQYHIGTQHSRSELKIANRLAENTLYSAEMWSTFASLMGADYPDLAIDKAWRQILFGQHHDALTGTPCDVSYLDLMNGYREALELARSVNDSARHYIASHVKLFEKGNTYIVFNPLNWSRQGSVRLP
ncbi:MAG TPA: hypothetical protein ENN56_04935, partial [Firmicutes bacterium]|nr:hypothetical protein [Bacillota bacterium]